MLFLISPAKALDYETPPTTATHTQPLFVPQASEDLQIAAGNKAAKSAAEKAAAARAAEKAAAEKAEQASPANPGPGIGDNLDITA